MKTFTNRRRRQTRGGAAVETAALMIVLIPLIMYSLFLEDLLFYHFDQQEAVVSTPWDLVSFDFRDQDETSMVGVAQRLDRLTYADHSSAANSYENVNIDTNDIGHHQAVAAHQCWLAKGGEQVTFATNRSVGDIAPEFASIPAGSGGPSGGMYTVSAILGVQNYFLPQKFMQDYWGTKNQMTDQERWMDGTDIHGNAHEDAYVFPEDHLAVVHDSYALNYIDESDSAAHPANMGTELTNWVNVPYRDYDEKLNKATEFADKATEKKILSDAVKQDGEGDDLTTPPVTWAKDPSQTFSDGTAPSGMQDQRVSATKGVLVNSYMGVDQNQW